MNSPSSAAASRPTACVILAAGGSRRLGHPKQLVSIDGHPQILRVVATALAVPDLWPVIVVTGGNAEAIRPLLVRHPVLIADNPAWEEGVASSLRTGLATAATFSHEIAGVLFCLGDQPALSAEALVSLLETRQRTGKSVVATRYDDQLGAPALIQRRHFTALAHLTGDEGARRLIQTLPATDVAWIDRPELAHDLDTPADLARWQTTANPQPSER